MKLQEIDARTGRRPWSPDPTTMCSTSEHKLTDEMTCIYLGGPHVYARTQPSDHKCGRCRNDNQLVVDVTVIRNGRFINRTLHLNSGASRVRIKGWGFSAKRSGDDQTIEIRVRN